jgi:hypothetical protein
MELSEHHRAQRWVAQAAGLLVSAARRNRFRGANGEAASPRRFLPLHE